jgi:hypothetical protein
VFEHAFELLAAFDEIVALGYKENVNLAQIRTYTEMDSHDERVHDAMRQVRFLDHSLMFTIFDLCFGFFQCQEREAKDRMKQRAKELDMRKRAERASGSKSYGSSTGISSNMYSSSSTDTKPDVTPTPVTYSNSSSSYVYTLFESTRHEHMFELDQQYVQVRPAKACNWARKEKMSNHSSIN